MLNIRYYTNLFQASVHPPLLPWTAGCIALPCFCHLCSSLTFKHRLLTKAVLAFRESDLLSSYQNRTSMANTERVRQPFTTLTFTPMGNMDSPINLRPLRVGGSTQRELTQAWGEHANSTDGTIEPLTSLL